MQRQFEPAHVLNVGPSDQASDSTSFSSIFPRRIVTHLDATGAMHEPIRGKTPISDSNVQHNDMALCHSHFGWLSPELTLWHRDRNRPVRDTSESVNTSDRSHNLMTAGLAVAALAVIVVVSRRRTAKEAIKDDEYSGPEPTEAEVHAAEESIRVKTAESVRRAKRTFVKSFIAFLSLALLSVPFMAGMPLHSFFRPWGQVLVAGCSIVFAFLILSFSGLLAARSYKQSLQRWLDTRHEPD